MDTSKLQEITKPLLTWFYQNARVLPWREDPTPYHIWISEIMLQQTRVEAVKPYYERFLQQLPDVRALAQCPQEQLMKLWEGLGYYNRARNMQKAAAIVEEEMGGELPASYQKLLSLPGIGEYTAGAIASQAFGIAEPAVDGNVLRVISRICENEEDILQLKVKRRITEEIRHVIPQEDPGGFNQALMELGACICIPNGAPLCGQCPVREFCLAGKKERQMQLPVKAQKKQRKKEERTVLVIRDGQKAVIRKRPEKGLLAGLYELPNYPGFLSQEEALEQVKQMGFSAIRITKLERTLHCFSHVEWHMDGYLIWVEEPEEKIRDEILFLEPSKTEKEKSIPSAFAAYMKYLDVAIGMKRSAGTE